jgi:hypothetical protein
MNEPLPSSHLGLHARMLVMCTQEDASNRLVVAKPSAAMINAIDSQHFGELHGEVNQFSAGGKPSQTSSQVVADGALIDKTY